jgi:hypothetical protein
MRTPRKIPEMTLLLNGVAVVALLAIATPSWAQGRSGDMPQGGNTMGVPGPNPGGPSNATIGNQPPPAAAAGPTHRHVRHATKTSRRRTPLTGSTTEQLNAEELARIQSGGAPPAPMAGGAPPPPMAQTGFSCPPGTPWVPAGYGNGKYIPGHCEGQAAR